LGFRIIAADNAPPVIPSSPVLLTAALASVVVVPAAKMRSRAALYRAERSAKVPAAALIGAGELGLGLELSLASPPFCRVGGAAVERFRMRMGDWKADAGGTTPGEMDPALEDVTTSWGMGTCLFLHTTPNQKREFSRRAVEGRGDRVAGKKEEKDARVIPYYLVVFLS
jgi:hypothetical protein